MLYLFYFILVSTGDLHVRKLKEFIDKFQGQIREIHERINESASENWNLIDYPLSFDYQPHDNLPILKFE
jgi:hypothetical protein